MDQELIEFKNFEILSPFTIMGSREQVSNELWLEIFGYLPGYTLKSLSLTYPRFKDISLSLLFTHVGFHPYDIQGDYRMPPQTEIGMHSSPLGPPGISSWAYIGHKHVPLDLGPTQVSRPLVFVDEHCGTNLASTL